jgi:hypothetical protein
MKVCPNCGCIERNQFRASRFDYDSEYMRYDEAENEPELTSVYQALQHANNFEPFPFGGYIYYRRGTGGLWLYRVLPENFRVHRERKRHDLLACNKENTVSSASRGITV